MTATAQPDDSRCRIACALLALTTIVLGGCAPTISRQTTAAAASTNASLGAASETPLTILISIDGLAANRLGQGLTPRLDAIAKAGASGSMRPSFPTNTFPNHFTLVTGLRPDHHGVVDNNMRDPGRPGVTFKPSDPSVNRDTYWWDGAEPIWVTAEKAGISTAILYWPGSDAEIRGVRPSSWWRYDPNVTSFQRVDMVLDWARRPAASRPRFIALYFDVVDKHAHNEGYDAPEERAAIAEADRAVGALVDGLAAMTRPANLVIVSDHGMTPIAPDHVRPISEAIDLSSVEAITEGPLLDIFPIKGREAAAQSWFDGPHRHLTCWRKGAFPARLHYGANKRTPPYTCLADTGWTFVRHPRPYLKGEHGVDPDAPDVAATFIAAGPGIRGHGVRLPRFDNVDLYPLLTHLIGLPQRETDGSAATLEHLYDAP